MINIQHLREVELFSSLSDEELQWLCEEGQEVHIEPGEMHRSEGDPADWVFVMIDGEVQIIQQVGEQELVLTTYGSKTFFGELPVLTGESVYWAGGRAIRPCHILELHKDVFWQMLAKMPTVTTAILQTMAKRVQELQAMSQHREKLAALGTMAAGLAHEMNNPVAAISRNAGELQKLFSELPVLSLKLNQQQMNPEQLEFLANFQKGASEEAASCSTLDPLTQCDLEDELTDWLEDQNVADSWKISSNLVSAGLDPQKLNSLLEKIGTEGLTDVLNWLEATLSGKGLLTEVEQGSARISELVQAIKDYSYMDQAPLQEVDVHEGLENTLTMMNRKLNGVTVIREYDEKLPRISAYGSELNQVWTNLVDNAIDAVNGEGKVWVRTRCENNNVMVEIADNGTGIPDDIQSRIFEPFFTTKDVGEGTGLGLDVAYRTVVTKHHGDLRFTSSPGDTRFQVRLPLVIKGKG